MGDGVGEGVGFGVGVGVALGDGDGDGVGSGVGLGVGDGVGDGIGLGDAAGIVTVKSRLFDVSPGVLGSTAVMARARPPVTSDTAPIVALKCVSLM